MEIIIRIKTLRAIPICKMPIDNNHNSSNKEDLKMFNSKLVQEKIKKEMIKRKRRKIVLSFDL